MRNIMKIDDLVGGLTYSYRHPRLFLRYIRSRNSPLSIIQHLFAIWGYPVTSNDKFIQKLKNKHYGRRCFIVGNGPSLRLDDLEKLNEEITIASNRIYVAFKEISWRPTYYTVSDHIYAENYAEEIMALNLIKFLPYFLRRYFKKINVANSGELIYFNPLRNSFRRNGDIEGRFSSNALRGLYAGINVTNVNLQLAYYLGCNPIYLIGIDGTYKISQKTRFHPLHKEVIVSEGENSHFHPDYRKRGETYQRPSLSVVEAGYRVSKDFLNTQGIKVYNASRSTIIKAFERVNLDDVLNPS